MIPHVEALIDHEVKRIIADKGYRGHGLSSPYSMRVFVSEQKRGVTRQIKRELTRRSAVEPIIDHLQSDHRMERDFLIGREGNAANAVLAAIGHNFARLLAWLRRLWRALLKLLVSVVLANSTARPAARTALPHEKAKFHG